MLITRTQVLSSLKDLNRKWRTHAESRANANSPSPSNQDSLFNNIKEITKQTWYLGFTAFGGPPVHFQIFHARFVQREKWVDEQTVLPSKTHESN